MKVITFNPITPKEKLVASRMGNDNWEVLMEDTPWCKDKQPSVLICKAIDEVKHMRWVCMSQVINVLEVDNA